MPEQWMSVAEAAATMKVHPRTVERRLAAGKIESRRGADGQVQILVTVPDAPESMMSTQALDTVKELADRQVDIAAGSASALVHIAQEQAMRAENQLVLARQDAGRYRKEAQMAAGLVAAMLVMVMVAVGWCTHSITAARADAKLASDRASQAALAAREAQVDHDRDRTKFDAAIVAERNKFDDAIIARAKAEGELAAYKTELASVVDETKKPQEQRPTTQPANLVARLAAAIAGE
jgi:hypothetical protein